jgi:CSLREA domain-containing protein
MGLSVVVALVVTATVLAQSSADFTLRRFVVGGGGGRASGSGIALHGTIGQAAVAVSSGGAFRLTGGFWPGAAPAASPTTTPQTPATPPSPEPSATGLTPTSTATTPPTVSATPGSRVLVVNTTSDTDDQNCDATHCSLREALNAVNDGGAGDTIAFAIPTSDRGCDGSGVCTIRLTTPLVELISDRTTIDGFTQPGAHANSAPFGQPINASLRIVLDGSSLPACCPSGLDIRSSGNLVRGLVIQRFRTGINMYNATTTRVEGNFIGTDAAGLTAMGSRCSGISVGSGGTGSSENTIGGSAPAARNLIAGSGCAGVEVGPSGHNRVMGNYIGTDVTGTKALGNNGSGVYIFNVSQDNKVGGAGGDEPNLVAFNGQAGIEVNGGAGAAVRNSLIRNRIHDNGGKGIALISGGNEGLAPPTVAAATSTRVTGTACPTCTVDVFSDATDEGAIYEGTVVADGAGNWALSKPAGFAGPNVTATATDANGNTSEFSPPVAIGAPTTTATASPSPSPSRSPTIGPSVTPGPSRTPTIGPSLTPAPSRTPTPTRTPTAVHLWLPVVGKGWVIGSP